MLRNKFAAVLLAASLGVLGAACASDDAGDAVDDATADAGAAVDEATSDAGAAGESASESES